MKFAKNVAWWALSVLLVALVALTAVSYKTGYYVNLSFAHNYELQDTGYYKYDEQMVSFVVGNGGVRVYLTEVADWHSRTPSRFVCRWNSLAPEYPYWESSAASSEKFLVTNKKVAGFQYASIMKKLYERGVFVSELCEGRTVTFPLAVILIPASVVMIWSGRKKFLNWRKEKRIRRGHCGFCGYDIQGQTIRCSECGKEKQSAKTAAQRQRFFLVKFF